MCGINGFNWRDENLIKGMNTKIAHRGPDDEGVYIEDGISLGHRRLSIIDLSPNAHQPMSDVKGRFWIVYNGELYNFKKIKEELGEFNFISNSDTEVILYSYIKWGEECLKKFNGIFSFAIWDNFEKKLFLARDHFGVKPLYYFFNAGKLIFSSEAKSILLHSEVKRELNISALNNYLRFLYVLGPETMWMGIKKMPPGACGTLKNGNFEVKKYYNLELGEYLDISEGELRALVKNTVLESVKSQLVSDRPVGLFLSGGLDSSIICAAMAKVGQTMIKTFSVGFETEIEKEKFNADFNLASKTAAFFGTDHTAVKISADDVLKNFENAVIAMDEPVSNHIQVATYLLAKEAKQKVAVVLGGDGGDETFGGYDRYYYSHLLDLARKYLPFLKTNTKFVQLIGDGLNKKEWAKKLSANPGAERFWLFMAQKEKNISKFFNPELNNAEPVFYKYASYFSETEDNINQMILVDSKTWLADESLIRSDKLTMAHGLEQRVPFLDKNVAELAFKIPSKYKLNNKYQGKKILRDAFAGIVPDFILEEKKRGFFSPAAKWIREGELRDMVYNILSEGYTEKTSGLFDWKEIKKIVDGHMGYESYGLNTIWSLLTFQVWAKNYL